MNLMTPWRRSTPLGRGVFIAATLAATLYGSTKNPDLETPRARTHGGTGLETPRARTHRGTGLETPWPRTADGTDFDSTNAVDDISIELRIGENGYAIRTSDPVDSDDGTPYEPANDDSLWIAISAPDCVVKEGSLRPLALNCTSDREIEGTLTLSLATGADKVSLWTAPEGGSPVTLPKELDANLTCDNVKIRAEIKPEMTDRYAPGTTEMTVVAA